VNVTSSAEFAFLALRLLIDLCAVIGTVHLVYHRTYRKRETEFIYYVFNIVTFCLCFVLAKVPTQLGVGLALFGVFGILRYRTEQVGILDLTYLFIVIGLGVLNGVVTRDFALAELVILNGVILSTVAILERGSKRPALDSTAMVYDQLPLLQPGRQEELLADLRSRTGLSVERIEIGRYDLLRDAAEITIYYRRRTSDA
jgi:hypothetical protein